MPIRDENSNCVTLWKYNHNPKAFIGRDGNCVKLPKLMFPKGRSRHPFNLSKMQDYKKENKTIYIMEAKKTA